MANPTQQDILNWRMTGNQSYLQPKPSTNVALQDYRQQVASNTGTGGAAALGVGGSIISNASKTNNALQDYRELVASGNEKATSITGTKTVSGSGGKVGGGGAGSTVTRPSSTPTYSGSAMSKTDTATGKAVNDWISQLRKELESGKTTSPDFSAVNRHVSELEKQLSRSSTGPKLPAELDLERWRTETATIDDIAEKYGFDYSRDYASQQAEVIAQARRDEIETQRERLDHELSSAKTDLDHDFFQQYLQQQQQMVDSGLNAGIEAERQLRLDMSRQGVLGDILANAQLAGRELDREGGRIESERLAYEDQLYNERLQQGFGQAMDYTQIQQRENQAQMQAAIQQREQQVAQAWREYEFNNMSESEKQRLLQNARQHGEEMAWREYQYNNMSAAEKARLVAEAEQFGMEMAWQRHQFEANLKFQAGAR